MAETRMPAANTQAKKEIKPVAHATKKEVKQSKFISTDIKVVAGTIFTDWIIPGLKRLASDTIANGIDILLFGEARHTTKGYGYQSYSPYGSYTPYYKQATPGYNYGGYAGPPKPARSGNVFDYQSVEFSSRSDAERVLDQLFELISEYGIASVGDFYQSAGLVPNYNDNKWGWTDIRDARVISVGASYSIKLPAPYPINK